MFPALADPAQPVPIATFRAAIPAMANPARYPDATLTLYLGAAHDNLNMERFGDMYALAQCWWAAHMIALFSGSGGASGGGSAGSGLTASKTVGSASISYDNSAITEANAGIWNSTPYGRMLWRYMMMAGAGPLQFN